MSSLEHKLLDYVPQMLLLVSARDQQVIFANRAARDQLGYGDEQLIGRAITDIESDLSDVFYWQDVANGQLTDIDAIEGLYLRADGSLLPVRKSVRVVRHDDASALLIQAKDIRHEREIEADLAQAMSQLKATLESTGNGILVLDLQGHVASMNRLFSRMWRLPEDVLDRDEGNLLEVLADRAKDGAALRRLLGTIVGLEETTEVIPLADGRVFECQSRPQYLGERTIGRVFGFTDITDRIRVEQQLKAAADTAESASRAKTDFLAMMSHEIRTPINGVMGLVALMLDTPINDEQRRYLSSINSSSEALLSIINDILDFSKIEMRKLTLEAIDFNLLALLEDLADLYGLRAAEKDIEFTLRVDTAVPPTVRGDPGRVRQILTNLIGNAVKFTSSGSIVLDVKAATLENGRIDLHFSVSDTGIGIPADRLESIFQRFEQADSSTTRKYGGTGLGLAITKELVELMDGVISVTSEEGKGARFDLSVVVAPPAEPEVAKPAAGFERLGELKGSRILVVDDNVASRDNLTDILAQWGFDVEAVGDAETALRRVVAARQGQRPYRCLLTDMSLPGTDGEALGHTVRGDPANAATALIICTSAGYRGDAHRFEQAGFAAYLCKPIRRALLLDCLLRVLLGKPQEAAAAIVTNRSLSEGGRRQARLLVVEDNAVNLMVMQGVLRKLGYDHLVSAHDGVEALERLNNESFDLVLMDCQMPRMDGYEATRALRAAGVHTPVVALTAHAMAGDREKCLDAGMDDYLTKPILVDKLAQALDKWLTSPAALGIEPVAPPPPAQVTGIPTADDFCYEQLLDLTLGDKELVKTVLQMFVDSMPRDIEKLRGAIAAGDGKQIHAVGHFIKGAAANIFAKNIQATAQLIEQAGTRSDLEAAAQLLPTLEARFQDFRKQARVTEFVGAAA